MAWHLFIAAVWAVFLGAAVMGLVIGIAQIRFAYLRWKALREIDRIIQGRR